MNMIKPSWDEWLDEAKSAATAPRIGMYLSHTGVVREDARAKVRAGDEKAAPVNGMLLGCNREIEKKAVEKTLELPGIYYVRTWIAEGELKLGDEIMRVLIGGDTRPHTVDALNYIVDILKNECVTEKEF